MLIQALFVGLCCLLAFSEASGDLMPYRVNHHKNSRHNVARANADSDDEDRYGKEMHQYGGYRGVEERYGGEDRYGMSHRGAYHHEKPGN